MHDSETMSCELGKLKDLDNLLKCAICYEYFKSSLITPCSHNFCSYCIRQSLLYRNQCPSCFEDLNESQLRSNRVVDEFISIFTCIKEKLFKYIGNLPNPKVTKENLETKKESERRNTKEVVAENTVKPFTLKSNVKDVGHGTTLPENPPSTSKHEVGKPSLFGPKEVQIPSMFSPKNSKSLCSNEARVPCPVCSVEIPEKNINIHLDACLKRTEEKKVPKEEKLKLPPKLVYHLLSDKDLRKKLQEIGLSTVGDRTALVNRHKRFIVLYKSECDSLTPKTESEIIMQLKYEDEEGKKSLSQVVKKLNVDRRADPKVNEEAQRQYLEENKSIFQKLTEVARKNNEAGKDNSCPVVTIDETSNPSENEVVVKRPGHKRKLITSDSETSEDEIHIIGVSEMDLLEQQTRDIHSKIVAYKGNEVVESKTNISGFQTESNLPNVYDDSTDVGTDDDLVDADQEVANKNERIKKSSNEVCTLQPSTCSNSCTSVTSPVLGAKSRSSRTPRGTSKLTDSLTRDLNSDFREFEACASSSPHGIPAGKNTLNDEADSDSSSNHSMSLMVYTEPECDNEFEQSSPTKIPSTISPSCTTIPEGENSNFDLGIQDILQNSEDFVSLPVRRQSTRGKKTKRNTAEPEVKGRVLRKRVKIDDL